MDLRMFKNEEIINLYSEILKELKSREITRIKQRGFQHSKAVRNH